MADLVKGVLGGTWSLIVGWILPSFLFLQLVAVLILPEFRAAVSVVDRFLDQTVAVQQATMLATAAVAGLVLAAAQAPLYRMLEGTSPLWPRRIAAAGRRRHQHRRNRLVALQLAAAQTDDGIRSGLLYERAARYPVRDKQFAPTSLGNAIRRFETYAGDRYQLDSQLLWHDLTAAAPDSAVSAVERARTNVDFFVTLVYAGALAFALGITTLASTGYSARALIAALVGIGTCLIAYQLAILATDEWAAGVRAVVHQGRQGVAASFGLTIPPDLAEERRMWRAVNTHVRRPFSYLESRPEAVALLDRYRQPRV